MSTQSGGTGDFFSVMSQRILNGYSTHTSGTATTMTGRISRGAMTASPRVSSTDSFAISSVVLPQEVIDSYERDLRQQESSYNNARRNSRIPNNNNNNYSRNNMNNNIHNTGGGASTERINLDLDSEFESNASQSELLDSEASTGMSFGGDRNKNTPWSLAERETQQIFWLKGITILIFLLASLLVSLAIFYSTRADQQDTFEAVYQEQANQIIMAVSNNILKVTMALNAWAIQYYDTNTISSNLQLKAQTTVLQPSLASWIAMAPLVYNTTEWEDYTQNHYQSWLDTKPGPVMPEKASSITTTGEGGAGGGGASASLETPYFPLWQHEPLYENFVNTDWLSVHPTVEFELTLAALRNPPTLVLGKYMVNDDDDTTTTNNNDENNNLDLLNELLDEGTVIGPTSFMYLPIVPESDNNNNSNNNSVVTGSVMAWMDWTRYIQTPLLDESADGIVVVLRNLCAPEGTEYPYQVQRQASQSIDGESTTTTTKSILQPLSSIPDTILSDSKIVSDISQELGNALQKHNNNDNNNDPRIPKITLEDQYCPHQMYIYATETVRDQYMTALPAIYLSSIILVFFFCALVFVMYDCLVERRQRMVMKTAIKSHEIVANLFPEVVRNRLFGETASEENDDDFEETTERLMREHQNNNDDEVDVSTYLNKPNLMNFAPADGTKKKPIADLFPNTTVLFADIAGFTAWSSVRDPSQVFTLLETVYAAFDKLALSRRVFKVETIGDCYVAVTGLPNPQENHAVIMVKFARDCLGMMQKMTQSLEVELGPDTGDLAIRIGMHSGPVTAGVLRGQKSRFQLFGDTVNFASRMESNGYPNQIQCSQQTADLLVNAGKQNWIHARKDMVHAKGKGHVQTYWVIATRAVSSAGSSRSLGYYDDDDDSDITEDDLNDLGASAVGLGLDDTNKSDGNIQRQEQSPLQIPLSPDSAYDAAAPSPSRRSDVSPHMQRLIKWNVDTLSKAIKKIVATRIARDKQMQIANGLRSQQVINGEQHQRQKSLSRISSMTNNTNIAINGRDTKELHEDKNKTNDAAAEAPTLVVLTNPRSEYTEAIELPKFDPFKVVKRSADLAAEVELSAIVMRQLNDFVTTIACAYNDNPFHNFEHASHVTMSAGKILKRVVNAEHLKVRKASMNNLASKMHDFTYGITSDPLTHFACLFSAMIHDVDHPGVSNMQLLKEKHEMAELYDGLSIAEQNSFDFAWELLMDSEFNELRAVVFTTQEELRRFRQLVINSIMATDVFDPELVKIRNERWSKAFPKAHEDDDNNNNKGGGDNGQKKDSNHNDQEQNNNGGEEKQQQQQQEKEGEEKKEMTGDARASMTTTSSITTTTTPDASVYKEDTSDLKATIVIEHIIQAADVAHTMQHWHVYQKWNRRLFEEMYKAYKSGRSPNNPADSWYKGELWFYDNYIIPLAKKLDECQVFGASSDEFLTYAMDNRNEWETKGRTIVQDMVESCSHQSEEFVLQELNRRGSLINKKQSRRKSDVTKSPPNETKE